jgi:hypothetical protein
MENFFIAKIVWQIKIENKPLMCEFDEQLRLIKAENHELAFEKAMAIGHNQDETFLNNKGQKVSWNFINVEFIKEIISFEDGLEICTQTINVNDAQAYINEINVKSSVNAHTMKLKFA